MTASHASAERGLRLVGVSYRYPGARHGAIIDVDLELAPGDVVGLVGANGAGKSTVALVASGLAPRTVGGELRGRVTVDGLATTSAAPHELAARCGIVFQNPTTQLSRTTETVYEEVAFGPRNLGWPRADVIAAVEAALGTLRIEHLARRDPGRLSGGQGQLVAIASMLAMRPRYLVLDEPTAQLDPAGTELVGEAMTSLASGGTGLLVAEQKTDLLAAVCSRVLCLAVGRVVLDGPVRDVLDDVRLAELGVGEPAAVRVRRRAVDAGLDPAALGGTAP